MVLDSKDTIKRKMIRNASKIWGYPDVQNINSFDPIVSMIIGALADELHKISGEIEKTNSRIVEKLIDLLFHHDDLSHFPPHALVMAKPVQSSLLVKDSFQFFYDKKIQVDTNNDPVFEKKRIFFTPTGNFSLFNGSVKYIGAGDTLYVINENILKDVQCTSYSEKVLDASKLFIGLELDEGIEKIDGLALSFNIRNKQQEEMILHSLSSSSWTINRRPVVFEQGFQEKKSADKLTLQELLKSDNDISCKTLNHINRFYNSRFMTLKNENHFLKDFNGSSDFPDEFYEAFSSEDMDSLSEKLVWIVVEFPQLIKPDILKDVVCSLNCFPIVNRRLNEFTQSLHLGANIIPLITDELFFDVKQIVDSKGTNYTPISIVNDEKVEKNSYFIRQGGIARFDSRDATEIIHDLMGLIRDESAAFSIFGKDMIANELKQLNQTITRLKQRIDTGSTINDLHSYIVLDCDKNYEQAFIQFWTNNGVLANNIRANSKLSVETGSDFESDSLIFITSTHGGREKLSKEDKLNSLRRSLLSKGRIVTNEDIKALCFEHFGELLKQVNIKKGAGLALGINGGYVRTIDIYLMFETQIKPSVAELNFMKEDFLIKLKNNSADHLSFRVFS